MSLVTYTLTAYIYDSDGDPIQDADLRAILSQVEVDDGYVVQRRVHVTTDAQGQATMDLWPNTRGTGTSHYIVWAIDKDGRGLFEVTLEMPAHDANLSVEAGAPIPDVTPSQDLLVTIQSMYADIIAARDSTGTWKDLAKDWAIEIPAKVKSVDYSSKNWAVGATIASAKRWATETASAVAGGLYSAKEWAIGTLTRGQAGGGSSKDWANYTGGSVDDIEYSSKEWAQGSAAASAKRWSEEAHNTPVEPGEYSSYHWATESENSATAAAASATGASNSENQAAGSASAAASSASAAQSSETAAAGSESAAASSASAAQSSETAAGLSETAAANSATSAQQSSTQAGNAATSAESARDKAKDWAENPEGSPVEPGEFSAYHWAQKAQAAVTGQLTYMGSWDASTGSYPGSPAKGQYYKVSKAGTVSGTSYAVGDSIIYNGASWDKIDNTDQVTSVVGQVGAITKAQIKSALETIASKFKIDVDKVDGEHAADLHKAANITGTLPVAHGGTGGTTAAAARTGLGLKSAATKGTGTGAGDVPLNSDLSSAAFVDHGTGAGDVPLNNTVMRPLGAFDASTGSYPASPTKGDWYRVSVEGTVSGRDLKVDDKIYYDGTAWQWVPFSTAGGVIWQTITGNKTFANDDSGTTFYTSADATLTLPDYSILDDTWVIEIVCDDGPYTAHTLTLATTGSDTVRNNVTTLNGDCVIMVSAVLGEFVVIQGPGKLGTAAYMDAVGSGGIIESGSNANGSYTKWADGALMCRKYDLVGTATASLNYVAASWTFPHAFYDAVVVVEGCMVNKSPHDVGSMNEWGTLYTENITATRGAVVQGIDSGRMTVGDQLAFNATAWGRWKA